MQLNHELTLPCQKQTQYQNSIDHISNILFPYKKLIIWLFILFQLSYHFYTPIEIKGLTLEDKQALAKLETYQMDKEQIIFKHLKDTATLNYPDTYMFLVQTKTTFIASYQWANLIIIKNKLRYKPDNFPILKEEIETYRSSNFFGITTHYALNINNKKNQQFQAAWKNLKAFELLKAWSSFDSGFQLMVLENQTIIDPVMEKKEKNLTGPNANTPEDLEEYYALIEQQVWLKRANSNKKSNYYTFKGSSLRRSKSSLSRATRVLQWKEEILAAANRYQIDPAIVAALIEQESGGNPDALSPAGAIGLMQLMPGTARGLGVNPFDPSQNIDGGVKYFSLQLKRFGNVTDAMIAYNAGPARVGQMLPEETQKYIVNVPVLIEKYRPYFV